MAKRSLLDLYVRGKTIEIDDGSGEPFRVWVQKLNPAEHSTSCRAADAARARILSIKNAPDSEEYLSIKSAILVADRQTMIDILSSIERGRIQPLVDAEKASEDEWKESNYLQGLRDAWNDGINEKYVDDSDDPEVQRVFSELERFLASVDEEVDSRIEQFEEGLNAMTDYELQEQLMDHNIRTRSDMEWMNEYYRQELFRGARDPENKKERLLSSRADVDELQADTFAAIHQALRELTVEPVEGKDSAATPPSSASSEPSEPEEADTSSGQKEPKA